jgi:hypothetical protein
MRCGHALHSEKPAVGSEAGLKQLVRWIFQTKDILARSNCPGHGTYHDLDWVAPGLAIADTAARIRAARRLRTPDALQAATAAQSEATGLVTNDSVVERVKEFETLALEDLL